MTCCKGCGKPIKQRGGGPRIWCSERCRKRQYDRVCVDCGGRCDGASSRGGARRCAACHRKHREANRKWTDERIIAAIWRWASEHGEKPPTASDWLYGRPSWAPPVSEMLRFRSWADWIEAAGFDRPVSGVRPGERRRRITLRPGSSRAARCRAIQCMWEEGFSLAEIARQMKTTPAAIQICMSDIRAAGWDLPYANQRERGYKRQAA